MAEKIVKNYMIILVIQILLTVVILFAASAIIWKCAGDESMVSAVVTGTYIIVSLVGGFTAGKMFEKNRYEALYRMGFENKPAGINPSESPEEKDMSNPVL